MSENLIALKDAIKKALPGAEVELNDTSGDGVHFVVYVESELFKGKTRVEQHRMVYDALDGKVGTELHALMVQTAVKG